MHTPGTLRNNRFRNDWGGYVSAIEAANPPIAAIGVTDYFCLRGYKELVQHKAAGTLRNVDLLFPNVELRLTVETERRGAINLHLLVSPSNPEHVERIEELLGRLTFQWGGQGYPCTEAGLIRLGRDFKSTPELPEMSYFPK